MLFPFQMGFPALRLSLEGGSHYHLRSSLYSSVTLPSLSDFRTPLKRLYYKLNQHYYPANPNQPSHYVLLFHLYLAYILW
jgi:hypothetical protein